MRLLPLFVILLLLVFAGCVKTSVNEKVGTTGQVEKKEQQTQKVDLGISESDLQVDDPALDPTTDNFDLERP